MLVTISDLHFCDNTTAKNISPNSFDVVLFPSIKARADKPYIEELHLVLAGDIFDLVRTDYWLKIPKEERPWNGIIDLTTGMNSNTPLIEKHYNNVLDNILERDETKAFMAALNDLTEFIPNVHITFIAGNHGKAFNNFDSLINRIRKDLKAYNSPNKTLTFANYVKLPEYSVVIRHGNEWTDECYGWEFYNHFLDSNSKSIDRFDPKAYKVQSIGEVLTAELMSGIIYNLQCDGADQKLIELIKDTNNIRPEMDVFDWLGMKSKTLDDDSQKCIYNSLKKSLADVLDTELAKKWDELKIFLGIHGDITDKIQIAYDLLKIMNYNSLHSWADKFKIYEKVKNWFDKSDTLMSGAECELENDKYLNYVIYGHSHSAGHHALGRNEDGVMKAYFNTGTFHSIIQRTSDRKDFSETPQMNFVTLYNKTERDSNSHNGHIVPAVDVWSGIRYV